ncbi:hypothetical protein [Pseudodesulfovibrio sp.]|uniref:hypothetical protein n=1 Tax=Pseudodesulfovibrio sp. TaxID=2035812 RepID=UPI0026155F15|nr:hypothetical protein [Pseudodesulfovibrio sp.]MDD3311671.1 hypothetical protein [Pseudodesulfovibrio sp.]
MNPGALIPTPDAIPVGWVWFEGLNILTFALHILMVNVLVGGAAAALYLRWRRDPAAAAFSGRLPTVFALTVNFGVAPLLFLQVIYGNLFYTSSILSAGWWLAVVGLLICGYYLLYIHQHAARRGGGGGSLLLGLGLILCIALVMTSVVSLMIRPTAWSVGIGGSAGAFLNVSDPTFAPRSLHFLFASLAVGGLALALYARCSGGGANVEAGMKAFFVFTLVQMATGLWWLMALGRPVLLAFLGDSPLATATLLAAVACSVGALAAGAARKPVPAAAWTVLTVLAMAGVRALARSATLAPWFSPASLKVTGEFSPLVFFLGTLAVGLAVVAYMLRLAFGGKEG